MSVDRPKQANAGTWLTAGLLLPAMLILSACNTLSGAGRDVEAAGETLSETADEVKEDIQD